MQLRGKVAVVTGAGGGIGGATSKLLASVGAAVLVADIDEAAAATVVEDIRAAGGAAAACCTDVADEGHAEAMIATALAEFGRLDILVNNAALVRPQDIAVDVRGSIDSMTGEMWDSAMAVNVRGPMFCSKHALKPMLGQGEGVIINVSSIASLQGRSTLTAYSVSKAALNALTRCIATAYGKRGIRCNAVLPGYVMTQMGRAALSEKERQGRLRHSVLAELGEATDVANMISFLASDQGRMVTGQLIPVDGGVTMHAPWFADEQDAAAN